MVTAGEMVAIIVISKSCIFVHSVLEHYFYYKHTQKLQKSQRNSLIIKAIADIRQKPGHSNNTQWKNSQPKTTVATIFIICY